MSFSKPPAVASSLALLAALAAFAAAGQAREANDLVFVMPPLKPLTGAAAPVKKPALANKGASPAVEAGPTVPPAAVAAQPTSAAANPAEPQPPQPQTVAAAGSDPSAPSPVALAAKGPEASTSGPASGDLPTVALNARIAVQEPNAPARTLSLSAGLQSGDAPSLVPLLDPVADAAPPAAEPARETAAAAEPAAESPADARIAAILAEGLVGPVEARIADRATLWLPAGRIFIPLDAARKLAAEVGLDWRGGMQGIVAPASGALDWLAPVELLDDGHIEIGDPGSLDPERALAAFRDSLPAVNAKRAATGQPAVTLEGWLEPPALDAKRRLSACVAVAAEGPNAPNRFFHCEAWALGRSGAIKIGLVEGAEKAERLKNEIRALAGTIVFNHGDSYDDFDAAADKVAPYRAADLLIHDVSARTPEPAEPAAAANETSVFDQFITIYLPLIGVGALLLYMRAKRSRQGQPSDPATERPQEVKSAPPSAAPASLVARLLPTLHARLARRIARPSAATPAQQEDASTVAALAAEASGPQTRSQGAADGAKEPVSVLRKFALRMRRPQEPPPPAVDPARALRRRRMGGAAPALAEDFDLNAVILDSNEGDAADATLQGAGEAEMTTPFSSQAAREADDFSTTSRAPASPTVDQEDFSLIEPGDAAASAAIAAARARRAMA
jgi:uncharacterized membrane-anchored protein